jgi:tRNA(Ile)-lysidine synthase
MSDLGNFLARLAEDWPPHRWRSVTVLLAVSGGADSVALLRAMRVLADPRRLVVAHFQHGLRPAAEQDAIFVRRLCDELGVPCEIGRAEAELAKQTAGEGLEGAARRARYEFLRAAAERHGARYVAVAHTADDQVETILHRVARGTGLAGLAGMPRARRLGPAATLVRPLLARTRAEVLDYLQSLGQAYREDETNRDLGFTRNRIRHDLLPKLRAEYNPEVDAALLRLGQLAGEAQGLIARQVDALYDRAVQILADGGARIDCSALAGVDPYLVRELLVAVWRRQSWPLRAMTNAKWRELAEMADGDRRIFPGAVRARREGDGLLLSRPS